VNLTRLVDTQVKLPNSSPHDAEAEKSWVRVPASAWASAFARASRPA